MRPPSIPAVPVSGGLCAVLVSAPRNRNQREHRGGRPPRRATGPLDHPPDREIKLPQISYVHARIGHAVIFRAGAEVAADDKTFSIHLDDLPALQVRRERHPSITTFHHLTPRPHQGRGRRGGGTGHTLSLSPAARRARRELPTTLTGRCFAAPRVPRRSPFPLRRGSGATADGVQANRVPHSRLLRNSCSQKKLRRIRPSAVLSDDVTYRNIASDLRRVPVPALHPRATGLGRPLCQPPTHLPSLEGGSGRPARSSAAAQRAKGGGVHRPE